MASSKRLIYYDTETTGIKPDKDRIIELAAYDPLSGTTFSTLINPMLPIPKEASDIHHITDDMVKDAPTFEKAAKDFLSFCEGDVILVAHNNDAFDKLFLEHEFKRSNVVLPQWKYIDSLKWARKYRSDLPKHSLQHLREVFGFSSNNAHRALDDVIILHQVFSVLIDDLSPDTILALLEVELALRHMPFGKHKGSLLQDVPKSYVRWLLEAGSLDKPENLALKKSFEKLGLLSNSGP